jgi:hemoglobin-like flavoprotein
MSSSMTNASRHLAKPSAAAVRKAEQNLLNLNTESREYIRVSWQQALSAPGEFAADFYAALFAAAPAVAGLFPGDMTEQRSRLTQTLRDAIDLVDSPQELVLLLRATGVRHLHYRVEHAHFTLVGQALLATVGARAPSMDAAGRKVWSQFYAAMSTIMRGGMAAAASES